MSTIADEQITRRNMKAMANPDRSSARISRLKANIARWGWRKTLFRILIKATARYLGVHIYLVRTRRIPEVAIYPDTNPDLVWRQITSDELLTACSNPENGLDEDFVTGAIERGDLAFGAFAGQRLVSYVWRSLESAPDTNDVWIRVGKPYNYAYKSFTHPDFRGQRISPVAHLYSDNEMRKLGYQYRCGFVSVENYSSLAMGEKMGSRPIGYAGYLMWFGKLFSYRTRGAKEIGFEFFRPKECE
jgi:hypothetical protein